MLRKFKFYFLGLIPGLILVFFILNQKGARCTGYLPNSRVIAETLSKKFHYKSDFKKQISTLEVTEDYLKDSIISKGYINFKISKPRKEPCPQYILYYPKENPRYELIFEKCADSANFLNLKRIH